MPTFHAIDPSDGMFSHNIFLSKGRVVAISLVRANTPGGTGMMSPYEASTSHKDKEEAFERVRASDFPDLPPRLGAIYLFPSIEAANSANELWWSSKRVVLKAEIVLAQRIALVDSKLLNALPQDWESAARLYWSGEMTAEPAPEILLDGVIQLQGWEPYGRLFGWLKKNDEAVP